MVSFSFLWSPCVCSFVFCSSHHSTFGPSHAALSMLSNFMGVPNIQNLSNLPHNDVLEKLKMQVGLMDPEFAILRNLNTPPNSSFTMPQGNDATSTTSASQPHNLSTLQSSQQKNFSFTTPNAPNTKDGNYSIKISLQFLLHFIFICEQKKINFHWKSKNLLMLIRLQWYELVWK